MVGEPERQVQGRPLPRDEEPTSATTSITIAPVSSAAVETQVIKVAPCIRSSLTPIAEVADLYVLRSVALLVDIGTGGAHGR